MAVTLGRITIVGLGPGNPGARTVACQEALDAAVRIVLRTAIHPGLADLRDDPRVSTCDDLYEHHATFNELYPAIVDRVLGYAATGDVVYAVPGQPAFGERTVPLLRARAEVAGHVVIMTPAVSSIDEIAGLLGKDPLAGELQVLDAVRLHEILEGDPFSAGRLAIDPYRPVLVGQVYSRDLAVAVKLSLGGIYPDEHGVIVVTAAGVPGEERATNVALHALDREPVDHLTSVWIPAMASLEGYRVLNTVLQVIARLRAPGGCPWDRKQTHASLRDAILEEAYEAADAIDTGDLDNLAEELGDLLLLVALHSQIATEAGHFTAEDVFEGLSRKLIRRHPHVFGNAEAESPADVVATWNSVKAVERGGKHAPSLFQKLPKSMPAMPRAERLLRDSPPEPGEPLPDDTPAQHLLASIWHLIDAGLDPELELSQALAERFGDSADAQGDTRP